MNPLVRAEQEVRKFAAVFLIIFALGFILLETIPNKQQGQLLAVVFGISLALIGASISEEQEREAAAAQR